MTNLGPSTGEIVAMWIVFAIFVVAMGVGAYVMVTEEEPDEEDGEPPVRPLPCCGYCGRNEGDDCGPIIFGMCQDCMRTWS